MLGKFAITVDTKHFTDQLGEQTKQMPKIARRLMGKVMSETKKSIKKEKLSGQVLHKRSGNMLKSIKFKTASDFSATIAVGAYYASMHENGPTIILPKKSPTLAFQIDGEWKRSKMVVLPRRQFALPVINDYWETGKAETLMDQVFDEALKQIYGTE